MRSSAGDRSIRREQCPAYARFILGASWICLISYLQ